MNHELTTVAGQPSWRLSTAEVEAFVTRRGGQLGPVTFHRNERAISPYALAPWAEEETDPQLPPMLKVLRGDFFCLPFGDNSTPYRGETHPPHGETANALWQFKAREESDGRSTLRLELQLQARPGHVEKAITLRAGHNAVYSRHTVSGLNGPMNFGHHAMLQFPDIEGSGLISTSDFRFGQVFPGQFEDPLQGGHFSLMPGAQFETLDHVPLLAGGTTDLSRYPARRGYEDLVMLIGDEASPFAWTAVSFPEQGYVWFALKDPRVLRQTILWMSNGGRPYAPWNGRHFNVLGLEEVTSYFHFGLAEAVKPNPLSERGIPTHLEFDAAAPLVVNYITAVAPVPTTFGRLRAIEPFGADKVKLIAESGASVTTNIELEFLNETHGF